MTDFTTFQAEQRRLEILRLLADAKAYTLDEVTLRKGCAAFPASHDAFRADLLHVAELGLIHRQEVAAGVWIGTLTQKGADVAKGLSQAPGVARPEPL